MRYNKNSNMKISWTKILWTLNLSLFSVQMFMKWLRKDPIISELLGIRKRRR